MRSSLRPTFPRLRQLLEFTVGLGAVLLTYLLFLLISNNAKILELVILIFELRD